MHDGSAGAGCPRNHPPTMSQVVQYRMKDEYGVETTLEPMPFSIARWDHQAAARVSGPYLAEPPKLSRLS